MSFVLAFVSPSLASSTSSPLLQLLRFCVMLFAFGDRLPLHQRPLTIHLFCFLFAGFPAAYAGYAGRGGYPSYPGFGYPFTGMR